MVIVVAYGADMVFDQLQGPALQWLDSVGEASVVRGLLTMQAEPRSDWFVDPVTGHRTANAAVLCAELEGDGQVSALVAVDFAATFDAGVLFVHQGADDYAKLCFEVSPAGDRTVVSVVTREVSDDANGPAIEGDQVYLRVSKFGEAIAFHWSANGHYWNLQRYFQLRNPAAQTVIGFCAQSPTGEGCTAQFSEIGWTATSLIDTRDGS